jgi:hypothetical protein
MEYFWEHPEGQRTACNCDAPECRGKLGGAMGGTEVKEAWQKVAAIKEKPA